MGVLGVLTVRSFYGPDDLLAHSVLGVWLALGSGAFVAVGALAEAAWQPGAKSRGLAFLLAGTSGCMVTGMLLEVVPVYQTAEHGAGALWGMLVLALTLLLLTVAEWLMCEPLVRLCRLQEALTRRAEQHPALDTRGTQLADSVINAWWLPPARAAPESAAVDPEEEEERAPTHQILQGTREHGNARHLRFLVRAILEQRLLEESLEDTVCRLSGRPIIELDVPIDRGQFHGVMRRLLGTSRTRSDLIWEELFKANDQNMPSLRVLAAAVQGHGHMSRGFTPQDLAQDDELDYEVAPRALTALRFADRILNGRSGSTLGSSPPDGGSTPTSAMSDGDASGALRAQKNRAAHLRLISRVRPRLEVLLATVGAAALHVFSGVCIELVVMADVGTGVVLVVLLAVRNFPEGVVFAKEIAASLGGGSWSGCRRWACLAGAFVGLCDFLGAALAIAFTKWTQSGISRDALFALYFVNGGVIVGLGIRKYLRAAVKCDPENKLPTIAWISGMIICGVARVAKDDHLLDTEQQLFANRREGRWHPTCWESFP
jgi:zinc transporter ZupT